MQRGYTVRFVEREKGLPSKMWGGTWILLNDKTFVLVTQLIKSRTNIKRLSMKIESKPIKEFEFDDGKVRLSTTWLPGYYCQ